MSRVVVYCAGAGMAFTSSSRHAIDFRSSPCCALVTYTGGSAQSDQRDANDSGLPGAIQVCCGLWTIWSCPALAPYIQRRWSVAVVVHHFIDTLSSHTVALVRKSLPIAQLISDLVMPVVSSAPSIHDHHLFTYSQTPTLPVLESSTPLPLLAFVRLINLRYSVEKVYRRTEAFLPRLFHVPYPGTRTVPSRSGDGPMEEITATGDARQSLTEPLATDCPSTVDHQQLSQRQSAGHQCCCVSTIVIEASLQL
jgi:hypothetical protein